MKTRFLKITKWFLGILLGIFLLITGALYLFKDEICGIVVTEVNKHLRAKVSVSKVDLTFWGSFPNLSVDFNDVFIQDSYSNSTNQDTLLYSERIRLKFNPIEIWNEEYNVKSIQVAPGTIQLKIRKNGSVNYDILQAKKDTSAADFELNLEKVSLEKMRFSYTNKATSQYYSSRLNELELKGDFTEKLFILRAKSNLQMLKAKSGNVTLLANKPVSFELDIQVNQETGVFEIPKALVYVSNLPFQVRGIVTPKQLEFEAHSKDIELVDVANNFSFSQIDEIKKFEGTGKVYFDLSVKGENTATSIPAISCDFGIENGTLTEPEKKLKIRKINLNGQYSNAGGVENEYLKLSKIRFLTPGGLFSGDLKITQFEAPNYLGSGTGNVNLTMLHSLFHLPFVEKINGNLGVKTNFNIQSIPKEDETMDYSIITCEGEVRMKNVQLKLNEDKRTFENLNGALYLRNDEAGIDNVELKIGASDLALNGVFKNIVNYFKQKGSLTADLEIKSKFLDVQDLGTTSKEEKIQDGRKFILPEDIDGQVFMEAGEIKYEKHEFKKLSGNMIIGNRKIYFPSISLQNAQADIQGDLTIEERTAEIFHVTTNVSSNNLEFKKLFREWDNFNQEVIGENNIFGKAHAEVYFEAPFDLRSGIISKSIKSQVYIKIQDGRLKNVEAFKSITESLKTPSAKIAIGKNNILGLEKKLVDLKFETLENTFTIQNGQLEIPAMVIHTNALDIETSGTHTFDNKINYRFAFRFRDLKEEKTISEFGEIIDDGTGMYIFMRMFGDLENPTVEWDKAAKKEQSKANREAEKQTIQSILKTEFGMFKNDSTVKSYQQKTFQKEELKIEFGTKQAENPIEQKKAEKDSKIKNKLKGWKEEAENAKKEKIDLN